MDTSQQEIPTFYELYEFSYEGLIYRYVANNVNIVCGGYTYLAATIHRDQVEKENVTGAGKLRLDTVLNPVFYSFLAVAPPKPIRVTISRYQPPTVTDVIFNGEIANITFQQGRQCIVELNELQFLYNNKVPTCLFQSTCNNKLFDASCALTRASFEFNVRIDGVDAYEILSSDLEDAPTNDYYSWGIAEFGEQSRMIINHFGSTIHLQYPFTGLAVGNTLKVFPGCNKTGQDCQSKFNNLANFKGFPYVPRKNPAITGL